MVSVLVAVGDPVVGIGLRTVLDDSESCESLEFTHDITQVRDRVARLRPDVVLLDVAFRRADGALVPDIAEQHPETSVLVYVDHSPKECGVRLLLQDGERARLSPEAVARLDDCCLISLQNQARGCVGTGSPPEAVVAAVEAVSRGEIAAAPWLEIVADAFGSRKDGSGPDAISARELEVMTLLSKGMGNKAIATHMGVREQTVKNYVTKLMAKLGVESRFEVGLLAATQHLTLAKSDG